MSCRNPKELLTSLPTDYTVYMAYKNNDVLLTPESKSYNTAKLNNFVKNVQLEIPDCILITTFGIDGPATTSVLSYDGNSLTFTYDNSRNSQTHDIRSFLVKRVYTKLSTNEFSTNLIYYVETYESYNFQIFRDVTFHNKSY